MKNIQYNRFLLVSVTFLCCYSCSANSSNNISKPNPNDIKFENNKIKVSVEKQKTKISELEELIGELNDKIEYQESMLNTMSKEFKDQMEIVYRYDSSSSDIASTLIKMKNKFEILEDKAFYTDSVYFEIVNDLVIIDSKISNLSNQYNSNQDIAQVSMTEQEYSKVYYESLNSFINEGDEDNSLNQFKTLISADQKNSLADNCQYWIGEIYYKQKNFNQSILEFEKVFDFPDSNKLDDAQYKIILCYFNLKNYDSLLEESDRLKKKYPNSQHINKVDNLLKKIKQ